MVNVFGDSVVSDVELETNSFGDPIEGSPQVASPKPLPLAEQEAFKQRFIQEGTRSRSQQVLDALTAGPKAVYGLGAGLLDLAKKGVQGTGAILGEAAGQPTLNDVIKNFGGNVTQTAAEIGPRVIYELGQAGVAGFQSPETASQTTRTIGAAANPLQAVIQALISPQAAPTEARAQQAFEESLLNEALAKEGEQGIAETAQRATGLVPAGEANIDVARGVPLVFGAEGLPGAIAQSSKAITSALRTVPRAVARISPTAETAGMSALNLGKAEIQEILPSAVPNLTKAAGKATPNASEIIQAAPKARKALFDETVGGLTKSKEQGLVAKGGSAADDAIEAIQSDARYMADSPDQAAALIQKYEKYRRDMDPLEAQKLLEDTNSGLSSHWDKSAKGQKLDLTDAELRAEKAFASNLSGQIDDLYKIGSRTINDPYRQIGKIIELEKNLKLSQAKAERAFAERVSPSRRKGQEIPLGKFEAMRKGGRSLTSAFRNTEIELLDKNLKGAFKGAPKAPPPAPLAEDAIPGLSRNYLPESPTPTPSPAAAPVRPAATAQTVEEIIKTFPRKLRQDPELARLAAEALLRSQASP